MNLLAVIQAGACLPGGSSAEETLGVLVGLTSSEPWQQGWPTASWVVLAGAQPVN